MYLLVAGYIPLLVVSHNSYNSWCNRSNFFSTNSLKLIIKHSFEGMFSLLPEKKLPMYNVTDDKIIENIRNLTWEDNSARIHVGTSELNEMCMSLPISHLLLFTSTVEICEPCAKKRNARKGENIVMRTCCAAFFDAYTTTHMCF